MLVVGTVAVGALMACTESREKERVWNAPGFTYVSQEQDRAVCEAVLGTLTHHRNSIVSFLGLNDAHVGQVRYQKFLHRQDLAARGHCSPHSSACFFRQFGIESYQPFEQHELIHAYLAHLGDSHKLLEEGVAEALTCDATLVSRSDVPVELAWSRVAWASTDVSALRGLYQAGGWFVAYLLKAYQPHLFAHFYKLVEPQDEAAEVAVKFASVYSAELAEVWTKALAQTGIDGPCVYAYACAAQPVQARSSVEPGQMARCDARPELNSIELDGTTWLSTQATTAGPHDWRLGACEPELALPHEALRSPHFGTTIGASHRLMLAKGKYWLSASSSTFALDHGRTTLVRESQCDVAEPLASVSLNDVSIAISSASLAALMAEAETTPTAGGQDGALGTRAQSWVLRLEQPDAAGVRVRAECSANARIEVCESCDYTTCQVTCDMGVAQSRLLATDPSLIRVTLVDEGDVWFRLRRILP